MSPLAALIQADAQRIPLADVAVHCAVTSPPYYGLRKYAGVPDVTFSDGWVGQLGNEPTPELYVAHMVAVFREVWRVLRDDGTLFLNLGDSYATGTQGRSEGQSDSSRLSRVPRGNSIFRGDGISRAVSPGYKPLDLLGIPWKVAFALRDDGWYLRSAIVWAKGISGQAQQAEQVAQACLEAGLPPEQVAAVMEAYSPYVGNCMPESVCGDRWERHMVKARSAPQSFEHYAKGSGNLRLLDHSGGVTNAPKSTWQPCPGCAKCAPHGGYILRRGNWRPTSAYELVFMLQKTDRAFTDGEGVKDPLVSTPEEYLRAGDSVRSNHAFGAVAVRSLGQASFASMPTGRNLRSVWAIPTRPYSGAHYAVFPPDLPELCIKAGTSAYGVCPHCGAPWVRVVERGDTPRQDFKGSRFDTGKTGTRDGGDRTQSGDRYESSAIGWLPTCDCPPQGKTVEALDGHTYSAPVPATVLDPFAGSGTTVRVALELGRAAIGMDLSGQYLAENAAERVANVQLPLMEAVL